MVATVAFVPNVQPEPADKLLPPTESADTIESSKSVEDVVRLPGLGVDEEFELPLVNVS